MQTDFHSSHFKSIHFFFNQVAMGKRLHQLEQQLQAADILFFTSVN